MTEVGVHHLYSQYMRGNLSYPRNLKINTAVIIEIFTIHAGIELRLVAKCVPSVALKIGLN